MRKHLISLCLLASTAFAAWADRGMSIVARKDLNRQWDVRIDSSRFQIDNPSCPIGFSNGFGSGCSWSVLIQDGVSALPGSVYSRPGAPSFSPFLDWSSYRPPSGMSHTSANIDSLGWWKIIGSAAQWAVMFDTLKNRHRSWYDSVSIRYCFSTTSACIENICFGSTCQELSQIPVCIDTACRTGTVIPIWRSYDTVILRRLHVRMDTARPYVRWLDTLGTLGDRWEPFLRAWKGGPVNLNSIRGSLRAADGKPLASTFSPTASLAFTRTPIPRVTQNAPTRGTILYSQILSTIAPTVTTGVLGNAKVDTSGHLYAKASIQWVNDSLAPRLNPPAPSDTGVHEGWIRAKAKWNFTVDGKSDSVIVMGWVPDPEFSTTTQKPSRKNIGSNARVDALGRPAVLRHQASDVRLFKP
ncbi:MAG: hypothetical protein IPK50_00680 [Fibrobacterota bacterium]|nr:hypothetical protein [Fibrobacterota bacterium]QQS05429.1 MAG: hypothetical protein IPK50_00680 [Fibrobacterota bacterium]